MKLDLILLHIVNGWCGIPVLDQLAMFADKMNLTKGGLMVAAFWWFWVADDSEQQRKRLIVATFVATFAAIAISRGMAALLPFRVRPMYALGIGYHAPSIRTQMDLENWSSFPSDHAAMFFALSYGLLRISRLVGLVALCFSAIWICLIRLYLGIHYPSDLLAGALVGIACGWVICRNANLVQPLLRLAQRFPSPFCAVAFLVSYETANMFDDVRKVLRGLRLVHGHSHEAVIFALLSVIGVGVFFLVLIRRVAKPSGYCADASRVERKIGAKQ